LQHTEFPDAAGSIGIAEDFTPQLIQDGAFMAASAEGAYIRLSTPIRLVTHIRKADDFVLPYVPDPIGAWKMYLTENAERAGGTDPSPQVMHSVALSDHSRLVDGTITIQGARFVFTGAIDESPPPGTDGVWKLNITVLAAPHETAEHDMPELIAMLSSERVNKRPDIAQINRRCLMWIAIAKGVDNGHQASFKRLEHNAEVARTHIDPAIAAVAHNLGGRMTTDLSWRSAIDAVDRRQFDSISASDFK